MKLFLMFESIKFGAMVDEKLPQSSCTLTKKYVTYHYSTLIET